MDNQKIKNNIYDPVDVDAELFSKDFELEDVVHTKARKAGGNILSILFSDETPQIMQGIGKEFQLNQVQSAELSRIVRKVLIADIFIGDIITEISKALNIQIDNAQNIANTLITKLFAPAIEDIKKIHRERFPEKIQKPQTQTTKQPGSPVAEIDRNPGKNNTGNTINLKV